jgi:hypothetical protein
VALAADWGRIDLPREEHAWLDAAKLLELGFAPRLLEADGEERPVAERRAAYLVLEHEGQAWQQWLAGPHDERLAEIDRVARSRLVAIDAGLDARRLRERYADRSRYAIVPGSVGVVVDRAPGGALAARGVVELAVRQVHVPHELLARLESFVPTIDRDEFVRRERAQRGMLPVAQPPRYRATVAFGRDGRPWLRDVQPLDAP